MSHDVRMKCIDIDIVQPRGKAIQAGTLDKTKEPFSIRSKRFFSIDKAEWVCVYVCFMSIKKLDLLIFATKGLNMIV